MYAERYQTESKEHEHYESLAEAGESAYFSLFLELDRLADSELARKLSQIDDTKNYGARSGTWHDSSGKVPFAEVFNWREPEKYEYVQVRRTAEGYRYSASHKSYYLRYELGPLYNVYFPDAEPEAYLFETDSLESLGSYGYLLPAFLSILTVLTADMEDYASAPGKNGESMAE